MVLGQPLKRYSSVDTRIRVISYQVSWLFSWSRVDWLHHTIAISEVDSVTLKEIQEVLPIHLYPKTRVEHSGPHIAHVEVVIGGYSPHTSCCRNHQHFLRFCQGKTRTLDWGQRNVKVNNNKSTSNICSTSVLGRVGGSFDELFQRLVLDIWRSPFWHLISRKIASKLHCTERWLKSQWELK